MKSAFDIIVCGSLHLDIVVAAKQLPRVDETAVGTAWKQVCGGKGGNQAVQASRAGAHTAMIGCIGKDEFGAALKANLVAEAVDVTCLKTDTSVGSGMSVAILQDDGEYGAVIVSGANLRIDTGKLEEQWNVLGGAKVLILQNEVPHTVNMAIAKIARSSGARVVLNAAPALAIPIYLLNLIDVLIVNRVEAEEMFDIKISGRAAARIALARMARHEGTVIITLGGDGLVVSMPAGDIVEIDPVPVRVTSTHGAGDCFVGTFCAQLAAGQSLVEACRKANATAAAFVSRPSTEPETV